MRRTRTCGGWRTVWAVAVVAAVAAALARGIRRTRPLVAEVADELRTPILYLPMDITNDATLQVARRLHRPEHLFTEEDVAYARRLRAAGVDCELHVEPGMFHGADAVLPDKPSMRAFRDRAVTALAVALDLR